MGRRISTRSEQNAGVTVAMILMVATAASGMAVSGVSSLMNAGILDPATLREEFDSVEAGVFSSFEQFRSMVLFFVWTPLVVVVLTGSALIACAIKVRAGRLWARPIGVVSLCLVALVLLPDLFLYFDVLVLVVVALAVAAWIALYRPAVSAYLSYANLDANAKS